MCLPAAHAADVIDFESGDLTGLYLAGETFASGDYTLTAQLDFGVIDTGAALGSQAPGGNATQYYFASNNGRLGVARSDAVAFNLDSFSAAFVPLDPPSLQQTVMVAVGTRADSSTVTAAWAWTSDLGGSSVFASYSSNLLSNLVSVQFRSCAYTGFVDCALPTLNNGQFAIDSIQVSAVPEPGSALLLVLGLAAFGLRQRRQAR